MLTKEEKIELDELLEEAKGYVNDNIFENLQSEEDKKAYLNKLGKLSTRLALLRIREADLEEEFMLQ